MKWRHKDTCFLGSGVFLAFFVIVGVWLWISLSHYDLIPGYLPHSRVRKVQLTHAPSTSLWQARHFSQSPHHFPYGRCTNSGRIHSSQSSRVQFQSRSAYHQMLYGVHVRKEPLTSQASCLSALCFYVMGGFHEQQLNPPEAHHPQFSSAQHDILTSNTFKIQSCSSCSSDTNVDHTIHIKVRAPQHFALSIRPSFPTRLPLLPLPTMRPIHNRRSHTLPETTRFLPLDFTGSSSLQQNSRRVSF